MTESTAVKKDTQRLQRAIVEGLEDIKAQDIKVFNTEHLSPLFERVIVASGTSNRQTKALAASVRDAVREAGFAKPRIEGEDNGEWIIVDCGAAVAHIMQPTIRSYYQLEEIWGEKPVRLKLGAPAPAQAARAAKPAEAAGKKKDAAPSLRRSSAAVKGQRAADAAAKEGAKPARKTVKGAAKPAAKSAKPAAKKVAAKSAAPASAASRLAAGKAAPAKKAPAKTAAKPAAKPAAKKAAPAKTPRRPA